MFGITGEYRRNLGRDHSQYGIRLHNLGHLHSEMGRFEEALPLFLEAVENTANSLGKEHSNYGTMLNNLSELYEDMGLYEDALPLFLEANTNLNRQLNQVFGISSEKNKQDFLNTFNNYFQQYHSFAFASDYRFDNLNIMLFDNELQQKGLILNSTKQTIEAVRESGDSSLIGKFTAWKNLRSQLAQQYSKPIAKRMAGLDSLEQLANTWEQELVQKSSAFATIRMPVSWQTIRDQLKKHEVAIEFVHFQYRNKSAADSVLYAAMILSTESARPEIIPLFEENELLALISKEEGVSEKKVHQEPLQHRWRKQCFIHPIVVKIRIGIGRHTNCVLCAIRLAASDQHSGNCSSRQRIPFGSLSTHPSEQHSPTGE